MLTDARDPVVVAENLRKYYGEFAAVAGIDFEVRPAECFGFLGPNGAGKTTTMKLIYCATPLSGGRLRVLGMDVTRQARAVKRRLGVVPQELSLDRELTVRANLLVYGRYFDIPPALLRQRVNELLSFVELTDKADADVDTLSGGMQRRLLIARGLINNPDIVILDEPTTGLDPQVRHHIWDKLRELKARGVTLLLTTHYMDEAQELCDRLVIMDRGKIIAEGTPSDLIARHAGRELVEVRLPHQASTLPNLDDLVHSCEPLPDRILLYTEDGARVFQRLVEQGFPTTDVRVRSANLEDVFLKLTGRSLVE